MNPYLLEILCDPISKQPLNLKEAIRDSNGAIISGRLETTDGAYYPIRNGIPRFVSNDTLKKSVKSFGDQWNFFNFTQHKANWLAHTVKNTFCTVEAFKSKVVVDAGGGSGAQSLWMLEAGAEHVILLELSDSVDDVIQRNLPDGLGTVDVIQCSIDSPPLKPRSISGIVYCHNVIQHTPSVEHTARALFDLVGPGGEFVFNCYDLNDSGVFRWLRFHCVYLPLRWFLSRMPFKIILFYARLMGILRQIPGIGFVLEKLLFCVRGDTPQVEGEGSLQRLRRKYKSTVLNTFDCYGSHEFQHLKRDDEIRTLIAELQPDPSKIMNVENYFTRPRPIGCALRVFR